MKAMQNSLQPVKFKLALIALLCGATVASLALFRVRTIWSGSYDYAFLIWNIFLAWIPLAIAYVASTLAQKRGFLLLAIPLAALVWLIFFPNAPYILTDLLHISKMGRDVPLWFDVLLLIWFSWTGLLLGLVSLFFMHSIVIREFGRFMGWLFVLAVGVLTSLGIYIGRFLRWNSWDLFLQPLERFTEFMYYASNPSMRSIMFIGTFSLFFLFVYITLYAFGLLFHEQARQTLQDGP